MEDKDCALMSTMPPMAKTRDVLPGNLLLTAALAAGLCGCIGLAAVWQESSAQFAVACCIIELLAYVSATDIAWRIVPNAVVVALLAVVCVEVVLGSGMPSASLQHVAIRIALSLANGCVLAGLLVLLAHGLECLTGQAALGGGDVKLLFALACYIGCLHAALVLCFACVFALIGAAVTRQRTFPFVPFIALAYVVVLMGRSTGFFA